MIPFASGRDADVFALYGKRVLRRYRLGGDVTAEAAMMAHVEAFGFPVPTVFVASGADLVLARIDGPTMLAALVAGDLATAEAARVLADLHRRLHLVPARLSADPAHRVLHLDLHLDNVLLGPDGPVVIDWRDSADGPPELDVAVSALIMAEAAVNPAFNLRRAAGEVLSAFLAEPGMHPLPALAEAVARRTANPALGPAEIALLPLAARLIRSSAAG
ncbi:aminoglycoside phosphotransferase (APT) family kinase protein [Allocatelliglobosispora scoriae]|uniref:Aminoglycoside phosphotransferase (APT) family kinase protein n=1 Tax=Allocatelliglobosispora scoriae TaxID=643052 RepID=A0A841BHZ3_9ACTN|nr:phosphotransferase [Allocatelliglobosispora scoriae]MBB5866799.1 aminoglycoside phosphotransferase (APT) family kinase protein [Allocatelliglobosispora scoriae]